MSNPIRLYIINQPLQWSDAGADQFRLGFSMIGFNPSRSAVGVGQADESLAYMLSEYGLQLSANKANIVRFTAMQSNNALVVHTGLPFEEFDHKVTTGDLASLRMLMVDFVASTDPDRPDDVATFQFNGLGPFVIRHANGALAAARSIRAGEETTVIFYEDHWRLSPASSAWAYVRAKTESNPGTWPTDTYPGPDNGGGSGPGTGGSAKLPTTQVWCPGIFPFDTAPYGGPISFTVPPQVFELEVHVLSHGQTTGFNPTGQTQGRLMHERLAGGYVAGRIKVTPGQVLTGQLGYGDDRVDELDATILTYYKTSFAGFSVRDVSVFSDPTASSGAPTGCRSPSGAGTACLSAHIPLNTLLKGTAFNQPNYPSREGDTVVHPIAKAGPTAICIAYVEESSINTGGTTPAQTDPTQPPATTTTIVPAATTLSGASTDGFYTVGADETSLSVELWAGGGGGRSDANADLAACGGSGAYVIGYMNVTPGQVIAYSVGKGGQGSTSAPADSGGATHFGPFLASGGVGGGTGGRPGSGGSFVVPAGMGFGIQGQAGDDVSSTQNTGRGGSAPRGGPGGSAALLDLDASLLDGIVPGGGGGSFSDMDGGSNQIRAGNGADGMLIVRGFKTPASSFGSSGGSNFGSKIEVFEPDLSVLDGQTLPGFGTAPITYTGKTYQWLCPAGITEIDVHLVEGGYNRIRSSISGQLLYGPVEWTLSAKLPVVPGNTYTITVGSNGGTFFDTMCISNPVVAGLRNPQGKWVPVNATQASTSPPHRLMPMPGTRNATTPNPLEEYRFSPTLDEWWYRDSGGADGAWLGFTFGWPVVYVMYGDTSAATPAATTLTPLFRLAVFTLTDTGPTPMTSFSWVAPGDVGTVRVRVKNMTSGGVVTIQQDFTLVSGQSINGTYTPNTYTTVNGIYAGSFDGSSGSSVSSAGVNTLMESTPGQVLFDQTGSPMSRGGTVEIYY